MLERPGGGESGWRNTGSVGSLCCEVDSDVEPLAGNALPEAQEDNEPSSNEEGEVNAPVEEVDVATLTNLASGAHVLQNHVSKHAGPWFLEQFGVAQRTMMQRVRAAAETFTAFQHDTLSAVVQYVHLMQAASHLKALAFIDYSSYDETKMRVRVRWPATASPDGVQHADTEVSNIWVVIRKWAMVLERLDRLPDSELVPPKRLSNFLVLRGCFTPAVRASTSTSGASVRGVLRSCGSLSQTARPLEDVFPVLFRLTETDEAGGNGRGEHMIMHERPPQWRLAHLYCMAHKLHSTATKTFQMSPLESNTVSAIIHLGLQMSEGGAARRLRLACKSLVEDELEVYHQRAMVSVEAERFKTDIISLFLPEQPKKRAFVNMLASFLNGSWDLPRLRHHCMGCCASRQESTERLTHLLAKVVTTLRPAVLNQANWMSWMASLQLMALGGAMHGFLPKIFARAQAGFDIGLPLNVEEDNGADHFAANGNIGMAMVPPADAAVDELARLREQRQRSFKTAKAFLEGEYLLEILLLRTSLEAERHIMSELLAATSTASVVQRLRQEGLQHHSTYPPLLLRQHVLDQTMCVHAMRQLLAPQALQHVLATEEWRSRLLRVMMRPAATFLELIALRMRTYPYKLFDLVTPEADAGAAARELLNSRQCLLDPLASWFRNRFPSEEALQSCECQVLLRVLASSISMNTYQGERLHSRNQRRSKRAQVPTMMLSDVALSHMGFSGLEPFAPEPTRGPRKRRGRPPKQEEGPCAENENVRKQAKGGGGAWRSFLSQRLGGLQFSGEAITQLAQEFRDLAPEQRGVFEEIGRQGPSNNPATNEYLHSPEVKGASGICVTAAQS